MASESEVLIPRRLAQISHVCLSHVHLDHTKGLCFLAEELSLLGEKWVTVVGDQEILDELLRYLFNNSIWPDFTTIPNDREPVIKMQAMQPDSFTNIADLMVRPVPMEHGIPTTGFIIKEGAKTVMMSSDTGRTEKFWQLAASESRVQLVIAHVPFPSRLADLAASSGHMTLSTLLERIDTYNLHHAPFYISHMKSMFVEEIVEEIRLTGRENLFVLQQG